MRRINIYGQFFYLNDYHWDFLIGPFRTYPYDLDDNVNFYALENETDVFTLFLLKTNDNGKKTDIKIKLGSLITRYDKVLPRYNIPIDQAEDRVKAIFAESLYIDLKHRDHFVCKSNNYSFRNEVNVFNKFIMQLQQKYERV